ncbi:hypothetical protein IJG93_00505 [Candidatus Saccharibacteria bacterium]|nr:hypothetical protein [Candidatus Saccharibacteria bacterium]
MRLDTEQNLEVKVEESPATPKMFTKHWLGYFAIGCSFGLSLLVLIANIGSAYGFKMAAAPIKEEAMAAEMSVDNEPIVVSADVVKATAKAPDTGGGSEVEVEDWHYYNTDLQDDGVILNDYNFGPNPVLGSPEALGNFAKILDKKGLKDTITMEEVAGEVDPKEIDKDFRERMRKDPALGAADMAWADSILGTRYLGMFYSEAKEKWDVAMNDAKEHFISDKDDYYKTLDAFEKYLDSATKVEIKKQKSGLNDQMYMNPFTKDEVPDIIVMESADHAGWFLVYTFTIKETATKEIKFRLDCGYQPTNVAEIMKVKAKKNPNKKSKTVTNKPVTTTPIITNTVPSVPSVPTVPGHPSKPDKPDRPDKPDNPKPDPVNPDPPDPNPIPVPPDPTPTPPKDPTNGTSVLPDDDPGPGENTNNPDNPDYSTKDQETNSNHMSPEDYDKAMEDNHWANESGREGGDSNEPSTPAPSSDTNVDSNADEGTGHGGIDEPTKESDSSVSHDPPGDHWDGPPD